MCVSKGFHVFPLLIIERLADKKMQRPSEKAVLLCPVRPDPSDGLTTHPPTHTHTGVKSQVIIVPFCSASISSGHSECDHVSGVFNTLFNYQCIIDQTVSCWCLVGPTEAVC